MRGQHLPDRGEYRDVLDRRWLDFMRLVLPECQWIFLPSLGEQITDYVLEMGISGLILTGGDDQGVDRQRDISELALFNQASQQDWPVLGVCRGMQMLNVFAGGELSEVKQHAGTEHSISTETGTITVNSYHRLGIRTQYLADRYSILATSDSGTFVEAFTGRATLGLMWHPEREKVPAAIPTGWIRSLFLEDLR
jgi:gamma-glutamyl-gamma-aminobutyrate hydrolase PuuD